MIRRIDSSKLEDSFFERREIEIIPVVEKIIGDVREEGDSAVRKYTKLYDGIELGELEIDSKDLDHYINCLSPEKRRAIDQSISNVEQFAIRQKEHFSDFEVELQPGVFTSQVINPVDRAGVYVPGGNYPLISSVIMSVVPAKVAGVGEIILCSPPGKTGTIHPEVLAVAGVLKVDRIYAIGGAQAIAAMAFGTETVCPVDLIVGPGNRYVTFAKKLVYGTVGIDFLAGPSEILIISDESGEPSIIAADMIAQAEHDVDANAVLITTSPGLADRVDNEIKRQLGMLLDPSIARASLEKNGVIIIVDSIEEAVEFANLKAPEHLELIVKDSEQYRRRLKNFGSLFIGQNAAEIFGDYNSGLNHILPTGSAARYTGGLSVMTFLKFQTTLEMSRSGIQSLGDNAIILAESENLQGHAKAVSTRKSICLKESPDFE